VHEKSPFGIELKKEISNAKKNAYSKKMLTPSIPA
jgi:hypothetical protein